MWVPLGDPHSKLGREGGFRLDKVEVRMRVLMWVSLAPA